MLLNQLNLKYDDGRWFLGVNKIRIYFITLYNKNRISQIRIWHGDRYSQNDGITFKVIKNFFLFCNILFLFGRNNFENIITIKK